MYVVVRRYRAAAIDGPVQLPFGRPSSSAVRRERNFRFTSGRLVPYTVARSVGPHTEAGTNSGSLVNGNFPVFSFTETSDDGIRDLTRINHFLTDHRRVKTRLVVRVNVTTDFVVIIIR